MLRILHFEPISPRCTTATADWLQPASNQKASAKARGRVDRMEHLLRCRKLIKYQHRFDVFRIAGVNIQKRFNLISINQKKESFRDTIDHL